MHKSYYSVLPCQNRLLQMKWDKDQYEKHRKKIESVSSTIDTRAPHTYIHLHLKPKKLQLEEERIAIIDRDNRILLEKMAYIMRTKGRIDNANNYEPRSLNKEKRQRELLKVTRENKNMMDRILRKGCRGGDIEWARDWQRTLTYMDNIARYPSDWFKSDGKSERGVSGRGTTARSRREKRKAEDDEQQNSKNNKENDDTDTKQDSPPRQQAEEE